MDKIDLRIVKGVKAGDKQAFNELFDFYYEKLCNYVASIIFDFDPSEDIVQELFARIWVNRKSLNINTSFRSYLYRSSYNAALDYLKHQKIQKNYYSSKYDELNYTYNDDLFLSELQTKMNIAIGNLPDQCQKIFKLSRFENLKYREIAAKLNVSENTVDTQIRRALKKLKEDLQEYLVTILIIFNYFF